MYANSVPLPLIFVSPSQINVQLPFDATASSSIVVNISGGESAPFKIGVKSIAPAIFQNGSGVPIIIRTVDGKLITDATPIHLNQVLNVYLTGMGPVTPAVKAGDASPH